MNLNRSIAPENNKIYRFQINEAERIYINGSNPVYSVYDKNCDVLRVEFYYSGGIIHQSQKGQAIATATLLPEGTFSKSSEEIAKALDYYGAYLQTTANRDESCVTLYCLPKHLNSCLGILSEILTEASYDSKEVSVYQSNAIQTLQINEEKTSYLAKRAFNKIIFGEQNSYGNSVNQEDIKNISRETLIDFYLKVYRYLPKYTIIAGNVTPEIINHVQQFFTAFNSADSTIPFGKAVSDNYKPERIWVKKESAEQCSLKIGKRFINRSHKDYREMTVVNMLLGGFFGSRLMKNIREEKGLTYGIYSSIEPLIYAGAFSISVELNKDMVDLGINEVLKEIETLQKSPVPERELEIVKNYYLGSFLRGFDGVFSQANYLKALLDYNLDYSYYYEYINVINNISPERIMELSQKHLKTEEMSVVVAGNKNG